MRCLVDVNVLLALMVRQHQHHDVALDWFSGLSAGDAGICRVVQLGVIRLLATRDMMGGSPIRADEGWRLIDDLLDDERMEFVKEPSGITAVMPRLLNQQVASGKLVTDAYLAAFAIVAGLEFVTLDAGFRKFSGLDLNLIMA
jgi:toxin-antitoxin system PIN domain toxin